MDFRILVKFCLKVSLLGNYNKNFKFIMTKIKESSGSSAFSDRSGSVRVLSIYREAE